jgi:heptose-I-phosphate ethanolaminephosphotransferase
LYFFIVSFGYLYFFRIIYYPIAKKILFSGICFALAFILFRFKTVFFFEFIGISFLYAIAVILPALVGTPRFDGPQIIKGITFASSALCLLSFLTIPFHCTKIKAVYLNFFRQAALVIYYIGFVLLALLPVCSIGYMIVSGGKPISSTILLTLFQTNAEEVIGYLKTQSLLIWGIAFVFIIASTAYIFHSAKALSLGASHASWPVWTLTFLLCLFVGNKLFASVQDLYFFSAIKNTGRNLSIYKEYAQQQTKRFKYLKQLKGLTIQPSARGIYVLVIGESLTRDHMHLYGYTRPTTPWQDHLSSDEGTVVFAHAFSNHVHTIPSLTFALSQKNQYNNIELTKAVSIIEIARAAGYETWWISNQKSMGQFDTPVSLMATTAEHKIWLNENSDLVLTKPQYDEALLQNLPEISGNRPVLIVLHLMGCHDYYPERYPWKFANPQYTGRVGFYDNAVTYNDFVILTSRG